MDMTSFSFLLYFLPVMLVVYFALSFSKRIQNLWLVLASLAFYALGTSGFLLLLLCIAVMNYAMGSMIMRLKARDRAATAKRLVALACVLNLLPLLYFRYIADLLPSLFSLLGFDAPAAPILPLGVSFLALRGISYVVDIYRGKVERNPNFIDAALYLTFFTSLQAGPIIRYHEVAGQIAKRESHIDDVAGGLCRFIVGLAKVVLLAEPVLAVADIVFNQSGISGIYTKVPVALAWLGLAAYGIGIYHYLSGFSDIVIGLGSTLGFTYPENFRHPHLAASVGEFWQRGYSTLTAWFDEYVYQPLSRRRRNNDWMVVHTFLMWLLIGLWIGPGLPQIILGVWSCIFIVVERIIEVDPNNTRSPVRHFFVMVFMVVALLGLKTDTIYQFTLYIANLFGMRSNGLWSDLAYTLVRENWPALFAGFIATFPIATGLRRLAGRRNLFSGAYALFYPIVMTALVLLVVFALTDADYNPYLMIQEALWS